MNACITHGGAACTQFYALATPAGALSSPTNTLDALTNIVENPALNVGALFALAQTGVKATRRFTVSDFGAVADGKTVNTKAIQSAIDKCAASGGGVVVVPPGTFLSGAIFLKQGVDLYIEKDGVLKATTNIDDYPVIDTRWEGTEEPWTSAFVNAEGLTDLVPLARMGHVGLW